jgi:tetratricopeptide (TPR) repeat protein
MAGREYEVLVNDALKKQLDGMELSELERFREKLEFLASGLWDSGLRVKKLKGSAGRLVFEARISKGDRLLFTLGRDRGTSIVYAWSIESHDDVDRAKRSVLPENAPFLDFEPLSVEERPDLVIDDLTPEYYTQAPFDGVEGDDAGPQRWRVLEDGDWKRLLDSSERQKTDLRLYLTEEQRGVLEQPPPLFLSGTAGSGKTTIAVYYLFRPLPRGSRRLFVTNHPYLCAYSERLYDGLAAGSEAPPGQTRPRFAPYRDIVREIVAKSDGQKSKAFDPVREVDFPAFERMLQGRKEFSSLDPELAWEEIRGIIKGANTYDHGKPILSFTEYQALGKKHAPRFAHDRAGIYAAAEWYQSRLRDGGLWDEIDLTRRAIDILATGTQATSAFEPWDLIVCDEAQDFTKLHVFLLFRLVSEPGSVVMGGDVKQIVNPSGFRWADMRALFWERGLKVPELFRLSLNFRSVGGIVSLGNALLDLKKRLVGIQSDETKETWKFLGKSPCLLSGIDEARVAAELGAAKVGAGSAIIVRDIETRERVKALARSELVFTVIESKGLEFDSTLLWKLTPASGDIAALWRRLAGDDRLAKDREARIVHEINLYYVAVTRARNGLVVYEENLDFWDQGEFSELYVRSSDPGVLGDSWRVVSTPEEWRKQGDYYFEREYWKAAAECYKNAGDETRESLARGLGLFAERRFAEAAGFLEAAGLREKAAVAYEESGDYRKATALWAASGDVERSRVCLARALEKEKDYAAAAAAWLELGDKATALRNLERTDDHSAIAELSRAMKLWEKSAKALAACGRHSEAAECWRKAKDQGKAAEAYYAAGEWKKAARYFKLSRQYEKIPDCLLRVGQYDKVAAFYVDLREPEKAIAALRRWIEVDPSAAATLRGEASVLEAKKPMHAALRLSAIGDQAAAGKIFMERREYGLALAEFRAAGDSAKVSACLEAQEDYYGAALEIERLSPDSRRAVRLLERYVRKEGYYTDIDRKLANRLNEEARALEGKGDLDRAANRYVAIGHVKAAYRCLIELNRDDIAFDFFAECGASEELGTFIREKKKFQLSHEDVMLKTDLFSIDRYAPNLLSSWTYLLDALGRCRDDVDLADPELHEELAALLPMENIGMYVILADLKHLGALDFLVRIGHLNGLFLLWHNAVRPMKKTDPYGVEYWRRIQAAALEGPLAPWFMVFLEGMEKKRGIASIDAGELNSGNTMFYFMATGDFTSPVEWYRSRGLETELEAFAKYLDLVDVIAEATESKGDQARAASWYEKARMWDKALCCYRVASDEAGIARMLEKTGALGEALVIWKNLGKAKDIKRVEKSIAVGKSGKAQAGRKRSETPRESGYGQMDLF